MSYKFVFHGQAFSSTRTKVSPAHQSPQWLAVVVACLVIVSCPRISAEEPSLLLAYSPVTSWHESLDDLAETVHTSSSTTSTVDTDTETPRLSNPVALAFEDEASSLAQSRFDRVFRVEPIASGLLSGRTLVLFQRRIASTRYSYDGWAKLRSGYGQVFSGRETLGLSRTGGVGVNETDYFYLKLSFSF